MSTQRDPEPALSALLARPASPLRLGNVLSRAEAETTAGLLRIVSDPTRLQLLSLMENSPEREACVSDLSVSLELRQPTVTYHLKILAEAGIIEREQRGRHVWCSIHPSRLSTIRDLLR